ncbi:MAG: hypothetical protein ABIQ11_06805 [Saprospiraceae bacterium]
MKSYHRSGIYLMIILCGLAGGVMAQIDPSGDVNGGKFKIWMGAVANVSVTKKADFSVGYMRDYEGIESLNHKAYDQESASFQYDVTKWYEPGAGIIRTQTASSGKITYRYYLVNSFKARLGDHLKWTNGLQVEKFSPNETRYDYRFVYLTRFGLTKRIKFLQLAPSVSYRLYYNVGGNKLQYYDSAGNRDVKETPDGFHRGRLIVNLNSKISDLLSVSLYYLNQHEFNICPESHAINIMVPVTENIIRPFNNYNVVGLSVKFNIDL